MCKRNLTETEGVQKMHSCFPTLVVKQIISPHVSPWICMPLKCLYPTKITVSQEQTRQRKVTPVCLSPKITHTVTFFVSFNHILVLPFNLVFNPALRCRLPRCLPPKLQTRIYFLFNKLTCGWRRCFSLLLDSEGSGDGGRERDGEQKM